MSQPPSKPPTPAKMPQHRQPQVSNFAFVGRVWPSLLVECRQAEEAALSNPRGSAFHCRRVLEQVVGHIADFQNLGFSAGTELYAMLNNHRFKQGVPASVLDKMHLLRKQGNDAVHGSTHFPSDRAAKLVAHLFDVLVWAASNYSGTQDAVPRNQRFDPAILSQAPMQKQLNQQQIQQLAAEVAAKDQQLAKQREGLEAANLLLNEAEQQLLAQKEAHARERALFEQKRAEAEGNLAQALAEQQALAAALRAELNELRASAREKMREEQAAIGHVDTSPSYAISEAETRHDIIDPMLAAAGFSVDNGNLSLEYRIEGASKSRYADYVLWSDDGKPLAVVEAKKAGRTLSGANEQAKAYADALESKFGQRPLVYVTNGHEVQLWDDAAHLPGSRKRGAGYHPRPVEGYGTQRELERLIRRRNTRRALADLPIDGNIAGRDYQNLMIRQVTERFSQGHRRALLSMATGTGKTRTAIALTKLMQQGGWVDQVLFLADRTSLVTQAHRAYRAQLPESNPVNLLKNRDATGQVYCCTYQTIIEMIDAGTFSPYTFDLIIVDEAHRTIYNRYQRIFDYFDALVLGLTATPRHDVDHNTYTMFHQEQGEPTGAYPLEKAIADGHLVPFRTYKSDSLFLRSGVAYDELSAEERENWDSQDWGTDSEGNAIEAPDEVPAAEINKILYNRDTIRGVLRTVVENGIKDADNDRIGKTIIFARNQQHADVIKEEYDKLYPAGTFPRAAVITYVQPDADNLIDHFRKLDSNLNVAISVDMLDTGVDIPGIVNLVFFKPVYSPTKFWQMIGRGTRLCPGLFGPGHDKTEFFVFDFCGNLEYFNNDFDAEETTGNQQKPLSQRIFQRRSALLHLLDQMEVSDGAEAHMRELLVTELRTQLNAVRSDNPLVAPKDRAQLDYFHTDAAWKNIDIVHYNELETLAYLPFPSKNEEENAKRFDYLILGLQQSLYEPSPRWNQDRDKVRSIARNLFTQHQAIPSLHEKVDLLRDIQTDEWWDSPRLGDLEHVRVGLRTLVRLADSGQRAKVITDYADDIGTLEQVSLDLGRADATLDLDLVEEKLRSELQKHATSLVMRKLKTAKPLTRDDVLALEEMVADAGPSSIEALRSRLGGISLPAFIRTLVGLDEAAMREAFYDLLEGNTLSAAQIRLVQNIIRHLVLNGSLTIEEFARGQNFNWHGDPIDILGIENVVEIRKRLDRINRSADLDGVG